MNDIDPVYFDEHASLKIDKAKKVTIPKEQMEAFEDAVNPDLAFSTRIKRLIAGKTKTSKYIGAGLDLLIALSPVTKPANRLRKLVKREVKSKSTERGSMNFLKRALTKDGGSWIRVRDEDGTFSVTAVLASLVRILILVGAVYLADLMGVTEQLLTII